MDATSHRPIWFVADNFESMKLSHVGRGPLDGQLMFRVWPVDVLDPKNMGALKIPFQGNVDSGRGLKRQRW